MLKFEKIIEAERLDVTIDVRNNIQMKNFNNNSGSLKKIIEINGEPE